jgi:hypothetical protein
VISRVEKGILLRNRSAAVGCLGPKEWPRTQSLLQRRISPLRIISLLEVASVKVIDDRGNELLVVKKLT